jgi:hypothetical protein
MKDITIYTNIAADGTIRWFCRPMRGKRAPNCLGDPAATPRIRYNYRILWLPNQTYPVNNRLLARSCRGTDCLYDLPLPSIWPSGKPEWSVLNLFSIDDEAFNWLTEPERRK